MNEVKLSNPTALGLASFALSLTCLSFANMGVIPITTVLPLAFFFAGVVEIGVGFAEFKTGNTFAMTVFGAYGSFWFCFASLVYGTTKGWLPPETLGKPGLLVFLVAWTILTTIFLIATFRLAKALVWIFTTLEVLFLLLVVQTATGANLATIIGYEGLLCAATAWYLFAAIIINTAFGKDVLPIGPYVAKAPEPTKAAAAKA